MLTSELYMHLALKGVGYIMFTNHYSYIRLRELSLPFHKLLILVLGITWSFNMYTTLNMLWSLDTHTHPFASNTISKSIEKNSSTLDKCNDVVLAC